MWLNTENGREYVSYDGYWVEVGASASSPNFTTIAVSGQSNIVADIAADTLTIVTSNGGISLTTDAATDTLTLLSQGAIICTSSTRPTGVSEGAVAYETDTNYYIGYSGSGTTWYLISGSGTYTPSWTNLTIGNGTTSAKWTFTGGADGGILELFAFVTLGTTSSMGTGPYLATPSGFVGYGGMSGVLPMGIAYFIDASATDYMGYTRRINSTNGYGPRAWAPGVTYLGEVTVTATVPFTWTSTDSIYFSVVTQGTWTFT